jgi:DNA-directed RNA polymerase specialized sigma24 family protein
MARIERLSIGQIAERMGRSPDAVKQLLSRALKQLRQSFGNTESLHLPTDRRLGSETDT